jgi:hypothetical protein
MGRRSDWDTRAVLGGNLGGKGWVVYFPRWLHLDGIWMPLQVWPAWHEIVTCMLLFSAHTSFQSVHLVLRLSPKITLM